MSTEPTRRERIEVVRASLNHIPNADTLAAAIVDAANESTHAIAAEARS